MNTMQQRWCRECAFVTKHIRPSVLDSYYCIRCFVLEDNYNKCVICKNKSPETERAKLMHHLKEPFVCDHCISTFNEDELRDEMQKNLENLKWALEQAKEVFEKEGKLPRNEKIIVDTSKCQRKITPEEVSQALDAEITKSNTRWVKDKNGEWVLRIRVRKGIYITLSKKQKLSNIPHGISRETMKEINEEVVKRYKTSPETSLVLEGEHRPDLIPMGLTEQDMEEIKEKVRGYFKPLDK